jgi:hypothetical protein
MTVTRKPQSVDDFIKGSSADTEVTTPLAESVVDIQPVKLRMPVDLLKEVDQARSRRKPQPSRHQFILEALYDKIAATS